MTPPPEEGTLKISGVYAIIHQPSGRAYVGSSCDVFRRWKGHVGALTRGRHSSVRLLDAWLLDGPGAFTFVILAQCAREVLQEREQEWLDSFTDPLNTSRDTRCPMFDPAVAARQGAKMKGRVFTPEHRANLSSSHKGLPSPMKGRTFPGRITIISQEQRAKISATLKNHPVSEESRIKMRAAKLGRPMNAETRARLSSAQRGRIFSATHRANLIAAWRKRSRVISQETRERMSISHRGQSRPQTLATRENIRAAVQTSWRLRKESASL